MILYFLRHGKADWPDWSGPDDERPLTEEGVADMRIVAAALKRLKVAPEFLLSSPLSRALRTAQIAADELDLSVEICSELEPGFGRREFDALIAPRAGADAMLVGHEPDFSSLVRALTGARVKLGKAAVAAVEVSDDAPAGRLLWLFPAKMLIRLYR
jgi:phosphohistidine phosphatase